MEPLISIIIPVYNAEKFLERCIYSILKQSFKNIQIILVNDGSTDDSGIICNRISEEDSRVIVFHQTNCGANSARHFGVNNAIGEWITFVDSDDYLLDHALETLYNAAYKTEFSIIVSDSIDGKVNGNEYRQMIINHSIKPAPWGKLFKRDLFTDFVFDVPKSITIGEDYLMNIRLARFGENIYIKLIPNRIYFYQKDNKSSLMSNFKSTIKYEEEVYEELKKSFIVDEFQYFQKDLIVSRLNAFKAIRTHGVILGLRETKFYIDLVNDMKKSSYKCSIIDTLALKNFPFFKFIYFLPLLKRKFMRLNFK